MAGYWENKYDDNDPAEAQLAVGQGYRSAQLDIFYHSIGKRREGRRDRSLAI